MSLDVEKIREDFPILKRKINNRPLIFLDSASTSQKPAQIIDAIKDYYEQHNANPHRSIYTLCDEATQIYEKARGKVAKFINAKSDKEIIFVRNTNEAMNILAYSYAMENLKEGDEIMLTIMEHHANIVPWQMLQKKGAVITIEFPSDLISSSCFSAMQVDEIVSIVNNGADFCADNISITTTSATTITKGNKTLYHVINLFW